MNEPAREQASYNAAAEVGAVRLRRSRLQRWWFALKKAPLSAWFGMIVIAAYVFVALFAPLLAPYGEAEIFPAPFGPISPVIDPCAISSVQFSTAWTPPKYLDTPST